jgi:hypothetical protein
MHTQHYARAQTVLTLCFVNMYNHCYRNDRVGRAHEAVNVYTAMTALLDKTGATTTGRSSITSGTSNDSNAALTYEHVELMWSALHGKAAALMQVSLEHKDT